MGNKIKNAIIHLLTKWLEDLFILFGVSVIVATTYFEFGSLVGNYLLGGILLVVGILIAKR